MKSKIKNNKTENNKFYTNMNMKTAIKKAFLFMTVSSVLTFSSCKKNPDIIPDVSLHGNDRIEAIDFQKTLSIISQLLTIKCKLQDLSPSDFFEIKGASPSAGIQMDNFTQKVMANGDTIKVIIDFDEFAGKVSGRSLIYCFSGIADNYGIVKEGRIIYRINSEKLFLDSGMTCDLIMQNFKIDGNKVNGMITIENKGDASYAISTEHLKVIISGKTVEIVDGLFTKIDGSCSYELTGHANVISSFGKPFTATITDKVLVDTDCRWRLVAGNVEFDVLNQSKKSIDFGKGDCDPFATVTVNNVTIPIIF